MFTVSIVALVVAGQIYFYRLARRALERRLGRTRALTLLLVLIALLAGALAVVWLDNAWLDDPWLDTARLRQLWGRSVRVGPVISLGAGIWVTGAAGAGLILLAGTLIRRKLRRRSSTRSAEGTTTATRREFLWKAARTTAALAPFGAAAYGTLLVRSDFELREVKFPVRDLPAELEGLRIALLTDIHFGPYLTLPELGRVIDMTNETQPHLTLVTGDFITRVGDPLETCLRQVARLRAEAGVFGCLGNHEIYADCQDLTESRARSLGIEILRRRSKLLQFGQGKLNLAGVDYQRKKAPYLVGASRLIQPGAVNLLMSHNPDVFPVAANLGYDLVVGGHTHGGQVTLEILEQTLNVGRFFTPFVAGLYRRGSSSLYVSRGIGTINLPMRLGARPEVSLLRLQRV